ncbi:MAG: hypothetical protein ACRBHB_09720 [Arenicella sp.]
MKTHNTLKTTIAALLLIVSSQTFSSESITDWEQYFYEEKQKTYQEVLLKLPESGSEESVKQEGYIINHSVKRVAVKVKLKEQITDSELRGKGGDIIYGKFPERYSQLYKKLVDVMHDLPMNSYTDFTFKKISMAVDVRLTKEGLDYLNSRDDVYFDLPLVLRMGSDGLIQDAIK